MNEHFRMVISKLNEIKIQPKYLIFNLDHINSQQGRVKYPVLRTCTKSHQLN